MGPTPIQTFETYKYVSLSLSLKPAAVTESTREKMSTNATAEPDDDLQAIAAAQRRELAAAEAFESDLELAFRLQMEEAITASLSLHPAPSSSSTPPPPIPQNEDAFNFSTFQAAEIAKLEQYCADLRLSESEAQRIRDDLHRRVHDRDVAHEINGMSEDEWEECGDDFERPFGEGSSNRGSNETFRVYFKGLVSEARVGNSKGALAGIGVAICDSRDELIFQLKKPLLGIGNSRRAAEAKALIEGLNAAIALDLKRVVFYCDYFTIYQLHVEVKLLHGMVPKCPHEGCNSDLEIDSCRKFLTLKLVAIMYQRMKEDSIPVTEKVYCPYPKCSALMSKVEVLEHSKKMFVIVEPSGLRKCTKCGGLFCINCKVPWHKKMSCLSYKRENPTPLAEDAKLKTLADRNLWRQCVKCNHMIELAAGCYHMTCRCGYEFCYTCGAEWKNKKATCTCPLWDEDYILDDEDEDDEDDDDDDDDDDVDDYDEFDSDEDDYY